MNKTSIEWTDYSSNLIKYRDPDGKVVYGCVKVSPGCANCYASAISKRFSGGEFTASRQKTLTPFFDEEEARRILRSRATGKKVFVGDMTDVFGEWVPDEMLDRMFAVFALRPDLVFQVLTKRPERMRAYLASEDPDRYTCIDEAASDISGESGVGVVTRWPLPNVWLGVSVEDQAAADERIPHLLATPAAVRFLSCEPLLEELSIFNSPIDADAGAPVGLIRRDVQLKPHDVNGPAEYDALWEPGIDWVIVGGESGPGARPCDVGWIRDIVGQCRAAAVPVFVKQLGARPVRTVRGSWINELQRHGPDIQQPYGRAACWACRTEECKLLWPGVPPHVKRWLPLRDRKGGDMSEWPEDLRVREYPS